jgi:hypothetical protein
MHNDVHKVTARNKMEGVEKRNRLFIDTLCSVSFIIWVNISSNNHFRRQTWY